MVNQIEGGIEVQTLHEASILCSVTHTETTLNTGDQSDPRMEAHICITRELATHMQSGGTDETHMAIRVYMLISTMS
jgi:hypothetical protein